MTINNTSIAPSPMTFQHFSLLTFALTKLNPEHLLFLILSGSAAEISAAQNPLLVEILLITFIATSFEQQFLKLVEQIKKNIKLWQIVVAIGTVALLVIWGMHPVNAQAAPGGGLFSPLQQQTNSILQASGAGQAGNSILGIFSLMNIIVTISGVGAVVYGAYQQSQGHTLRESFTPLALVLVVYIGCSFVMRMFLGTGGG